MYSSVLTTLVGGISTKGLLRYGVCIPPHSESCAIFEVRGIEHGNNFVECGAMIL